MRRDAIELLKPALGTRPETFYPIDMTLCTGKFIVRMQHAKMLTVSDINQPIVAAPAVRVNDRLQRDMPANHLLQRVFTTIRNNLGMDLAVTFEDAEDDGFTHCSTPSLASDMANTEIAFVNLDFAVGEGRGALTFFSNAFSDFQIDRGDAAARKSCQLSRISGCQIKREVAHELTEFTLPNFRPSVIPI